MSGGQAVLILAAGHGTRMGGPKVFAQYKGQTFLHRILARCAESSSPVTVTADSLFRARIEDMLATTSYAPTLVDCDGLAPMLATVQAGLAAGGCESGFWLWPVDAPFISTSGWASAVDTVRGGGSQIVKLRVRGRTGHPIWFPGWSCRDILAGEWKNGLLGYLAERESEVVILPLEGEILTDVNTPDELARIEAERTD